MGSDRDRPGGREPPHWVYAAARLLVLPVVGLLAIGSPGDADTALRLTLLAAFAYELCAAALVLVRRERLPRVALAGDIALFTAITMASGGAASDVAFFAPILLALVILRGGGEETLVAGLALGAATVVAAGPDLVHGRHDVVVDLAQRLALLAFSMALFTSVAYARAAAEAQARAAGAERRRLLKGLLDAEANERRRLSGELHEGPLQQMLALRQDLEETVEDPDAVARAEAGVVAAIVELRDVIARLHPVALDHSGLSAAVRSLADRAVAEGGLTAEVHIGAGVDGLRDILVVSVARELLGNVVAHANAENVLVRLTVHDGARITLEVRDDGAGFDPAVLTHRPTLGLGAVQERVHAIGGAIEIDSAPGRGTRVLVGLPV